jgi:ferric-dicitrate binding protein FerR (iron transport regulator)
METNKFKERLERYLKGQSSQKNKSLVEAWYKSYQDKEKQLDKREADRIGYEMREKINASIAQTPVFRLPALRVAASFLIAGGIALLIWGVTRHAKVQTEFLTIKTGTNDIKQLTLADSSVVWVNSASVLQVPASFQGKLREVKLLKGEAFFDVKHDSIHPFIVRVKGFNVQVMGTSFNIKAYSELKTIDIAVATGKVGVGHTGDKMQFLLPGKLLSYNTGNGQFSHSSIDVDKIRSWKSGLTYLQQADFNEVALVVKNIFGLTLKAGSGKISNYRFTLTIQHNSSPDQMLKVISQIHNTQFRKEGNSVILY